MIFNPEIIFTLVDEKPTDGVGYFMILGKEYLKLATKKSKYETLKSLVNQGFLHFSLYVGNRVTGYNLFEGSNPLLSAMKKTMFVLYTNMVFLFDCYIGENYED